MKKDSKIKKNTEKKNKQIKNKDVYKKNNKNIIFKTFF